MLLEKNNNYFLKTSRKKGKKRTKESRERGKEKKQREEREEVASRGSRLRTSEQQVDKNNKSIREREHTNEIHIPFELNSTSTNMVMY